MIANENKVADAETDEMLERVSILSLSKPQLTEIAEYIKEDTFESVDALQETFQPKKTIYTRCVKRIFDIVFSLIALILTAPINLIIAVVTIFDVGRPIIFKQTRIGKNCKPFYIYKFRNMTNETDANGELLPPSQRVTKWGRFVRKTSLDELLNFVSIIKGDMSLIGPRPLVASYAERVHRRHKMIYSVKPGLECPFLKNIDHEVTWGDRFDNYVWYAENVSFATDIKMCFRMLNMLVSRDSTQKRSVAGNGSFLGYDSDGRVIESKAVPQKYVDLFLKNNNYSSLEDAVNSRYTPTDK